jgi:hypothetical protein
MASATPPRSGNRLSSVSSQVFIAVTRRALLPRRELLLPPAENGFSDAIAARHLGGPHTGARGFFQDIHTLSASLNRRRWPSRGLGTIGSDLGED